MLLYRLRVPYLSLNLPSHWSTTVTRKPRGDRRKEIGEEDELSRLFEQTAEDDIKSYKNKAMNLLHSISGRSFAYELEASQVNVSSLPLRSEEVVVRFRGHPLSTYAPRGTGVTPNAYAVREVA